jgi:alpha-beta hydrolase superfamily lysophospholipase
MQHSFFPNSQGLQIFTRYWHAENPRAVVALVHGQGEHVGRYEHWAALFNQHHVSVVGIDLQGYGRSEGKRGHAKNLDALLDDIGLLLEKTRALYPELPLFLYGHSMGGCMVLNYVTRRSPALSGLIATGPWIRLAFQAPFFKVLAGKLLRRITPSLTLPTGLAVHFISHDEAVVRAYKTDPLVTDQLSTAAGMAILEAADWLDQWEGRFDMPVLLMHGGSDMITSAAATREFARRAKGDITYREWPGLYHEIHNEKENQEVFEYLWEWMQRQPALRHPTGELQQ